MQTQHTTHHRSSDRDRVQLQSRAAAAVFETGHKRWLDMKRFEQLTRPHRG